MKHVVKIPLNLPLCPPGQPPAQRASLRAGVLSELEAGLERGPPSGAEAPLSELEDSPSRKLGRSLGRRPKRGIVPPFGIFFLPKAGKGR